MKVKILRPIFLVCSLLFLFSAVIYTGCNNSTDKKSSGDTTSENNDNSQTSGLSAQGKEIFYKASTETGLMCADCHSDGSNTSNTLTKYFSPVNGVPKELLHIMA